MRTEPVGIIGAAITIVSAIIAVAVGFGLNWTGEQVSLVMSLVSAAGYLVQLLVVRRRVSSPHTVTKLTNTIATLTAEKDS